MPDVGWALAGTIVGFLGGFVSNYLVQERRYRLEERSRQDEAVRAACVSLMTAVRELRYLTRRQEAGETIEKPLSDEIRTRVSTAYYELEILAPERIRRSARALRLAAFAYWNGPREGDKTWDSLRTVARRAHDAFVETVRSTLRNP